MLRGAGSGQPDGCPRARRVIGPRRSAVRSKTVSGYARSNEPNLRAVDEVRREPGVEALTES